MKVLAESGISNIQMAMLIAGGALIYAIMRWRRVTIARRRTPAPETPSNFVSATGPLSVREVAAELQALLAELEETSRRLTAQLDNRYTRLEQLIVEADEKIRQLEALGSDAGRTRLEVGATRPAPSAPSSLRANVPLTAAPEPASSDAHLEGAQRTLARLRQERGAPPAGQDPAYEPIYSLADRGKSSREIAQELGRQPGEIELILALRQRAGEAGLPH